MHFVKYWYKSPKPISFNNILAKTVVYSKKTVKATVSGVYTVAYACSPACTEGTVSTGADSVNTKCCQTDNCNTVSSTPTATVSSCYIGISGSNIAPTKCPTSGNGFCQVD